MFYSKTTRGFYDPEINLEIPDDARELSQDQYIALFQAQAQGFVILADPDGMPVATMPAPQPVNVPTVVNMAQARLALLAAGKLDAVEAAVAGASKAVQVEWDFRPTVERDSPTTAMLAAVLGLSDAELDQLFTAAAAL